MQEIPSPTGYIYRSVRTVIHIEESDNHEEPGFIVDLVEKCIECRATSHPYGIYSFHFCFVPNPTTGEVYTMTETQMNQSGLPNRTQIA